MGRYDVDMADFERDGSAAHQPLGIERELNAEGAYARAFDEWEASGEQALWDQTTADGLSN